MARERVKRDGVFRVGFPDQAPQAYANDLVTMFKETPLLSAMGIVELIQAAKIAGSETFRYAEPFTAAAVLFLAMSLTTVAMLSLVERRLRAHLAP